MQYASYGLSQHFSSRIEQLSESGPGGAGNTVYPGPNHCKGVAVHDAIQVRFSMQAVC